MMKEIGPVVITVFTEGIVFVIGGYRTHVPGGMLLFLTAVILIKIIFD